ncbi:MAG: ester cyclase [Chlorobi bacterium]|jgi:steroid delta-isomerase-like uncharacterized protein|nr:ester cyclase [Chlorobiota bacterium]
MTTPQQAMTLIIIGVMFHLLSCNQQPKGNAMNDASANIQQRIEQNKGLVRKWILEGWNNNRNQEIVAEIFASNWADGNPAFPNQPKGIEGAMYYVNAYRSVFPDIQFTITHIIAQEDYVCFRFLAEATHRGELMGIPATGKKVNVSGIVIHRIENGKFAESWNEVDLLGVKEQLLAK